MKSLPLRQASGPPRRYASISWSLALATLIAGCGGESQTTDVEGDGSGLAPLRTLNPVPKAALPFTVRVQGAPGNLPIVDAAVQYDVINPGECGKKQWLSGAIPRISSSEALSLAKVSDTEYTGTVFADQILEGDYYGRGVCRWQLVEARVSFRASTEPKATWFLATIQASDLENRLQSNTYFWKGYYPNAEIENYAEFGSRSDVLPETKRAEYFQIVMSGGDSPSVPTQP